MYVNVQAVVNLVSASIISYKYLINIRYLKESKLLLTLPLILEKFRLTSHTIAATFSRFLNNLIG